MTGPDTIVGMSVHENHTDVGPVAPVGHFRAGKVEMVLSYTIDVAGAPDFPKINSDQFLIPSRMDVTIRRRGDGDTRGEVTIYGARRLKGGGVGGRERYSIMPWYTRRAPSWILDLIRQTLPDAIAGVPAIDPATISWT